MGLVVSFETYSDGLIDGILVKELPVPHLVLDAGIKYLDVVPLFVPCPWVYLHDSELEPFHNG